MGGVIYVLFIVVIAIILLAFLPCVNFVFQLCFDTTTAVASIATRGAVQATNASAGGGQTGLTRGIERGQRKLGAVADRTVNPAVQRQADKVVRAGQRVDRAAARLARRARGLPEPPPKLRRQKKPTVGTGAAVGSEDDTDVDLDERFLSPQQRRSLMLARRGHAAAPTGVIRGFANRVIDLSRRLVNFGVPPAPDPMEETLIAASGEAEENPVTEPQPVETSSGHGDAYDALARQLAGAVQKRD